MELLTVNELAELLKISRNKVVLMARRGEIPAISVGGKLRFDADEIEKWLKANAISFDA
jgi:excisionase family DNA binding protein